jgi:HemY protein
MTRTLWFCLKVAILVGVAWYLAERQPGQVSLEGWGYRIDTSVGILLLAAGLVAVLAAIVYRSWGGIKRTPGDIGRKLAANREKRGYRALTQGMVAVAAGEAGEAQRWARKADELLDAPPLTMLLSAQAAQLDGDHQAAKRYFNAMLERDETRFLGLRGLITQALRDGDEPAALEYVRSAHTLRPNTPWVLETLFDLSEQAGDLEGAERAAREAAQGKVLPAPEAKRKHAVVLLERAYKAQHAGDPNQTLKLVKQARKAAPDLVPASVLHAELLVGSGRRGTAARMLERAWGAAPHPALIEPYRAARPGKTEIEWLNQVGKLTGTTPTHPESLLALAEAALDAKLWGEARRHLGIAAEAGATHRVCRLMARLEEAEHGDLDKAREWLMRAGEALPDPAWVCDSCGALASEWQPRCGACDAYDGLAWHTPPRVPIAVAAAAELVTPEAPEAPEAETAAILPAEPVEVVTNGGDSTPPATGEAGPAPGTEAKAAPAGDGAGEPVEVVPAPPPVDVVEEAVEPEAARRASS